MSQPARPLRQEAVLVVEDDPTLRLGLTKTLRSAGYRVETAQSGTEGAERAKNETFDLVLLDLMMPGKNGYEVCEELREYDADLPIIMLTAKGEEDDKVRGLGAGADDYVTKPFGVGELLARVDSALRRRRQREIATTVVEVGTSKVNFGSFLAERNGENVEMTALEMKLLRFFLDNEGRMLTRQRILDGVWGTDYFGTDRTVDNFVNRLRVKFELDPKNPAILLTVRGGGYRFSRRGGRG